MPPLPGICGPANRPCKISHSTTYPNQVGVYPSQFLPSSFTIWHAVFASNFPNALPSDPGTPPFGLPIAGLIGVDQFIPNLGQTHTFQSHHYIIFAKTANRLNVAHVLTQSEIDSMGQDGRPEGIGVIDVGEYVFEAVAAVDQEEVILTELTEQELIDILETGESDSDRAFRKLFEQNIPAERNRLVGIQLNKLAIEYRFDNGTDKSRRALNESGLGDANSASYRDGSSKILEVDLAKITDHYDLPPGSPLPPSGSLQSDERQPRAGDTIYLTYVAITKHYLRQRVNISWQVFDGGSSLDCVSLPLGFSVINYRFYDWQIEPEPNNQSGPVLLSGWRAVESFSTNVNFVAAANQQGNIILGDFLIGGPTIATIDNYDYVPGNSTISEILSFQANRPSMPTYQVNSNQLLTDDGVFHVNQGVNNQPQNAFASSAWYNRNLFNSFEGLDTANQHVFFNIHSNALKKRDIDKFGIEASLAQEIEKDIQSNVNTFFPFMDDPSVDNPTNRCNVYLSASNAKFEPVQPISSYTNSNLDALCGSLGSFPTNPADGINTYHSFESNIIREQFDVNTRVLVERNFAVGAQTLGPRLITIEGRGGARGSLSCICDPSKEFAFVAHIDETDFIIYNSFRNSFIQDGQRQLEFRPDQPSLTIDNNTNPVTIESLIGPTGMAGDLPGILPGRTISISAYSNNSSFVYKTSNVDIIHTKFPQILNEQILPLDYVQSDKLVLNVGSGFHQMIEIAYELPESDNPENALVLFKSGESIIGTIDTLSLRLSHPIYHYVLRINCQWMVGDTIEIIGPRIAELNLLHLFVIDVNEEQSNDFLHEQNSHAMDDSQQPLENRLTTRSVFFESDVCSISEDDSSNLFLFFNDNDGGISCASSKDYGDQWYYYYGIVEKFGGIESKNPFVITNFRSNESFLFFQLAGNIMCKKISFSLFNFSDANLIQRFDQDVFTPANPPDQLLPIERTSIYSDDGQILRRKSLSYVAAGNMADQNFWSILGYNVNTQQFETTETRLIETANNDGSVSLEESQVIKTPFAIGSYTAFNNADINDIFFSVYRKDNGEMKLWFLQETQDSGKQLQCHFSNDNGQNWYDFWEYANYRYNRLRSDPETNTQFIDYTSDGLAPSIIEGSNPLESNNPSPFGINIHWSRLKKHKKEGGNSIESESNTLEVDSPYLFLQTTSNMVFLFYIYQQCLLCKTFSDDIFSNAANVIPEENATRMNLIKTNIEKQTKSMFIDGFLNQEELFEEIQDYYNEETDERMTEGNILFRYQFALSTFDEGRSIQPQRICAYELPNGQIRVFYKDASRKLKAAIWTGLEFWPEEFLRRKAIVGELDIPEQPEGVPVTGGFGVNRF